MTRRPDPSDHFAGPPPTYRKRGRLWKSREYKRDHPDPSPVDLALTPEQKSAGVHDDGEWRGPNLQEWLARISSRQLNPDGAPTPSIRQSERHAPSWEGPMIRPHQPPQRVRLEDIPPGPPERGR